MLHVRSKHIYQALVVKCLSGVGCLVEKRRFSQPLQTVRIDRTPPVVPVVPSVRLFCFVLFCMSAEWGQTHGPVPVLAPRLIWWAHKHSLLFNSRCLVVFLLLRGRGECGCVERVVLCELKRQMLAPKCSECSFVSVVSLCGLYPHRLLVLRTPFYSCCWWWCVPECDPCSCGHTGLVQFNQNSGEG